MWTEQQQRAISARKKNILISAAAGSGKTAVLTERILQKIKNGEVSADRLVVVTFTKAAAAEMRERIRKGLEAELRKNPGDKGLYVQMTLLGDSDICTIDSFCNRIVQTHFEEAGIDPAFRIAEDGEMALVRSDVFSAVIEEFYKEGGEDFFDFASSFSSAKNDSQIEKIIYNLYDESDHRPWPDEWLEECLENTGTTGSGSECCNGGPGDLSCLENSPVLQAYIIRIKTKLRDYAATARAAIGRIYEGSGVEAYKDFIENEVSALEDICGKDKIYEFYKALGTFEFETIPSSSRKGCDEELKTLCKGIRDKYKKYIKEKVLGKCNGLENKDDFFLGGRISGYDALYIKKQTELIVRITRRFSEVLKEEKKKRNIATFADVEHMALNILVRREGKSSELTPAAVELKSFYDEILTDEYQDSNALQEEILSAIAKDDNRYMVGDVKQSIYAFRGSDPGMFLSRYEEFGSGSFDKDELIILQNNFRSRDGVLEGCNRIFSAVMNRDYTGISYDESEKLVPSYDFDEYGGEEPVFSGDEGRVGCEVILCGKEEFRESEELEGLRIAEMIKQFLYEGRKVFDTKKKEYRNITYRDIVVLCRKRWTCSLIAEILNDHNVPSFAESTSVYTETYEIRPVISLLKIIDNPLDDVEFTAVMLSYFGGFTADDTAVLRSGCREEFFYNGLLKKAQDESEAAETDPVLLCKVKDFLNKLHELREEAASLSVYDLLWRVVYETGYYSYLGTMPGSKSRLANTDLLLNRAFMFTGTSYNGLFQFLRYLERIGDTGEGKGEISAVSEIQDVVRVMTIHKSKGLEFPVVFLAGMGKTMNMTDATDKEKMIIGENAFITDVYDNKRKVKRITAFKRALQAEKKQEYISEELRLLYVAMTRAVEKLYMIGTYKGDDIKNAGGDAFCYRLTGNFGINDLDACTNFFKCTLPVILNEQERGSDLFEVIQTFSGDISAEVEASFANKVPEKRDIKMTDKAYERFAGFKYPFEEEIGLRPKVTVSELKRMGYADEKEAALDYREKYEEEPEPEEYGSFSEFTDSGKLSAAGRGTLYHRFLEHMDPCCCGNYDDIKEQIVSFIKSGILPPEAELEIEAGDILKLMESDTGQRIQKAFRSGNEMREQQFMMGIAREGRSEDLLVQGVVDLCFEEEGGLVILDYKTDRVRKRGGESVLKKRYGKQLEIYGEAMTRATGKPVKEKMIYSFALGSTVVL